MSDQPETSETTTPTQATDPTSASGTFHADDVSNRPRVRVQHRGVVTYRADHVPEDAPSVLSTKVVTAPEKPAPDSGPQAETK